MKRFINISFLSLVFAGMALTGCNDDLTTSSYVKVNDEDVLGNVSQLEKVLTSAYKQLYFNTDKGDRVYAGLPGFQMYVDASGADVISHTNMGGDQVTAYQYSNSKTQADGNASKIWSMCYNVINRANIILTNPEMLNSAFLPNHSKYGFDFIFSNLKYIVIDELHSYRGAFGAHLTNLFRRMKRICNYYQSAPQFLCSSATIANPVELAELICGASFVLIDQDGSPAPEKEYRIIQPPLIKGSHDKIYGRKSASSIASEVVCRLVENEAHFIAFAKSRRNVEVILKESRDKLDGAAFLGSGGSG
ncbi:DEAD/DEAH box helicase, partial [Parabacteroides goldsteinii]|uniref:DEAD/DEAH box helicase n=1 Tax=Parabacteroides goldsteinii TaxID=328812 RepID=UPI0025ADC673